MHFLGYEGTMSFQSQNWRIPTLTFSAFHNVNFTVPAPALIRVYTEAHAIDIDIKLLTAAGALLASGSNAIGTEEEFTYMLSPNTAYTFQLQFYNFPFYGYTPSPCDSFNMEIEIGPIPTRTPLCPTGSYYPQIPSALTLPYSYNSIDSGSSLYYQQVSKQLFKLAIPFSLPTTANIHIEIGYNFLVGDLVLGLYSSVTKETIYGTNFIDRNVINLVNVPSGSYQLTIYEAAVNLDSVVACSEFTFALYAEAYAALIDEDRYLIEYYLPNSLDALAYMLLSGKTHLANDLFMFDGTGQNEATSFTLKEASLLRVDALLTESEYASGRIEAPVLRLSGSSSQVSNGSMLVLLQAGSYTLTFLPPASLQEENDLGVIVSVQISINTQANLQAEILLAPQTQECASTQFSNVMVSPTGAYQDGASWATVSYAQLSTGTDVVRLPFTLDRYSVVYLQVGTQFLLSELEVRIYNQANNTFWHGRMRKNINQIHQGLPAGSYFVLIRQTIIQTTPTLAHCGFFSYSFIIKDGNDPNAIVDCSSLQTIPWQLDSNYGGSSALGGPISSNGTLHLYGDGMHITNQAASYINFTLSRQSILSVLVVNYPTALSGIDFTLISGSTTQLATGTYTAERSRLSLYTVQPSQNQLAINYRRSGVISGSCLSFSLQIDIAPAQSVQSAVACPAFGSGTPLPTAISIDATSNVASGSIASYFQGWGSVFGLSRTITFTTTTQMSNLVVTLSFNSLVNSFTMKLMKSGSANPITTAQPRGSAVKSGATNVYLYMAASLLPGDYSIVITHPSLASPFTPPESVCPPFIFEYSIGAPTNTSSRVEISDVSPPSLAAFNPAESLAITITFTGDIYTATKQLITSVNSSVVAQAFYLSGSDLSTFTASQAVALNSGNHVWRIVFSPFGVVGVTYTLTLKSGQIYDQNSYPISLPSNQYKYKTSTCGHGTYNNEQGVCVCYPGYAGSSCDGCDVGYVTPTNSPGLCVPDQCFATTCGCLDSSCRTPLGDCTTNTSGLAHCTCIAGYVGEHCEACAPGYGGVYPNCQPQCSPACVHGVCVAGGCKCTGNYEGKACNTCPTGFTGVNCDTCADGYSGDACDQHSQNSDWGATKVFLEVTGVLVIVALVAAGAFWYWRYRRSGARYRLVSRFSTDDEDDSGHHFPDNDNRLVDDEEVPASHEHEEDDYPRVDLPQSSGAINSAPEPVSSNPPRLLDM
jgi:hypothetical protein